MRRFFLLLTLLNVVSLGVWFEARLLGSARVAQSESAFSQASTSLKSANWQSATEESTTEESTTEESTTEESTAEESTAEESTDFISAGDRVSKENLPPYPNQSAALCLRLGPFSDALNADAYAAEILPGLETNAQVEERIKPEAQRFWLYLDPPDDEARETLLKRLEAQGVDDVLWLREGPHAGVVSLGLYASEEGRDRRLRMLRAAGFEPRVEVREGVTREHWRAFVLPDEMQLSQLQNNLDGYRPRQDTGAADLRIEKIDCIEPASETEPTRWSRFP